MQCDNCRVWLYTHCIQMIDSEYHNMAPTEHWFCLSCRSQQSRRLEWGAMDGEQCIRTKLQQMYSEIVTWRKNIFMLPRGRCGSDFIREVNRILGLFVNETPWKPTALLLIHVFMPIMLQLPSPKSKAKQNAKYLSERLQKWKSGDLDSLMKFSAG